MTNTLEFILRMALACLCGAVIGIERTVRPEALMALFEGETDISEYSIG